ncbi:YcnI family protein [Mycobacterium xenopi]|uniref:YcnI family protein n=1 Tax=Mycobacterium xenopi TaxID=1789 RepID=UPI0022EAAAE3|nr:YcnI family protein [Mycobacterium xenopi]MDA3638655.1 YcnI family protein [Mycobacterium xenopi]MDA3662376.1 YcnI family protein [Mycobacterium xenopi]
MPRRHRLAMRIAFVTVSAATLYVGAAAGVAPAWAHVHVSSDNPVRGNMAIVTFEVPNESPTGAPTTALSVALPGVAVAGTETVPGWTAKLDRDAASGAVRSVTWTAVPNGGIPADQFALFRISLKLPDSDTVTFPATQTYADGSVVKWDEPPLPGGAEPEHPAPRLPLVAGPRGPLSHHMPAAIAPTDSAARQANSSPDNTARLLGGCALLVAALGVGIALLRRRA